MARPKKNTATKASLKADSAVKAAELKTAEVKNEKPAEAEKPAVNAPVKAETVAKKSAAKKRTVAPKAETAPKADTAPRKRAPRKPKPVTVNDVVAKVYNRIDKAAAKQVAAQGRAAIDIKLYGQFEAHMYIEVKDGKVSVEPYDYIERDLEAAVPVDVALAIADGKITVNEAVENGSLYIFGNVQFALMFAKLFD